MSASLVGSEMCIRDRGPKAPRAAMLQGAGIGATRRILPAAPPRPSTSVSYTHLTLPTICSV
eukprot:1518747-Alexandrium_andersonii.AAC.1